MTENFSLKERMYDSSALSDYMGCPKLFYFAWVRQLVTKEEKPALAFGRAFHEVLRTWYKTNDVEKAIAEFAPLPDNIADEHRTKQWGEAIFKQYVERYATEQGRTLYLEKKFIVEIGDKLYAGRIDRVEEWNNNVYVDDHKTTKSLGLSFFAGFRPNIQIDGYCYACREIVGRCDGAIINGISVAKNPKERFQRFPSGRTNEELDRFRNTFIGWTDEIERSVESKIWKMNTGYCNRWGKCKFWELCVYGEDERMVEQHFKVDVLPEKEEEVKDVA